MRNPADRVERWPLERLIPYARNARTHSDEQIAQLAGSMREWGVTFPVLVDEEGTVLAGHAKILAARKLGLTEVPVVVARGWTKAQRRAYSIADNKIALNAQWDEELLGIELVDLKDEGFDLGLTGFSSDELKDLLAPRSAGLTNPDDCPSAPAEPVSRRGDIWLCGRHRVVCGDSTDAADVALALDGARPHLMVTDPPYGVVYDPTWRAEAHGGEIASGRVLNDDRADWREAWALFPGEVAYVWHAGKHGGVVQESLEAVGFELRSQIIWVKARLVLGRGDYHWKHEPCFYAVRRGGSSHWTGSRKQSTVWEMDYVGDSALSTVWVIEHRKSETGHGTQKPVEAMRRPIVNNSRGGEAIYDPFLGSGTTLIAAEIEGRVCRGLELNPAYVDVIVRRWQDFTGCRAVRANDERAFAELAA